MSSVFAANNVSPILTLTLDQIELLSQYELREMVRRMDVVEARDLEKSKRKMIFRKLSLSETAHYDYGLSNFKILVPIVGDELTTTYKITVQKGLDFNEILDQLPYGSFEVSLKPPQPPYFMIRSFVSNIDFLKDIGGVIEVSEFGGNPKDITIPVSGSTDTAFFVREPSQRFIESKEDAYKKARSLFSAEIEYVTIKVQLAADDGMRQHARAHSIIRKSTPEGSLFSPNIGLVSLEPTVFDVTIPKAILDGLYTDWEVENIIPFR